MTKGEIETDGKYAGQIEVIVGALIVNPAGQVLLGKQKKWDSKWTVFGGHVEHGEGLEDAILREIKEETNCDVRVVAQIGFDEKMSDKGNYAGRHLVFLNFLCEYVGVDEDIKLNEEYEPGFKWFTPEDALGQDLGGGTKELIESYQKYITQNDAMAGWQRCLADFDNYKKRQQESQRELSEFAGQNVLQSLLPVVDNFHSATAFVPEEQKDSPWLTGIMFIQQQLDKVLEDNGMVEVRIEIGDEFDPETMEAVTEKVAQIENEENSSDDSDGNQEDQSPQTVTKIITKGYKTGQKIIRPARVVVG